MKQEKSNLIMYKKLHNGGIFNSMGMAEFVTECIKINSCLFNRSLLVNVFHIIKMYILYEIFILQRISANMLSC